MKKPNNYWTKERCKDIALKYNNRNEFRKHDASCYRTSLKNKWLDDICSHMKYKITYWNYKLCSEESLKYKNKSDFMKYCHGAYDYAIRNNILNDICSHMIKIGNKEYRCVYVFEFDDNSAYVGLTYNLIKRENEHNNKGPVYKHILKTKSKYKLIQLTDYIKKDYAQTIEEKTINSYKYNKWNVLNTNMESTLGGSNIYWTFDKCKEESLKYNHRNEFRKMKVGAYNSARLNGWLNDICSHMKVDKSKRAWSEDDINFLIENKYLGLKYCSDKLNKTYISVKNKSAHLLKTKKS